jgi:hypothetical protein
MIPPHISASTLDLARVYAAYTEEKLNICGKDG